MNGADCDVRRHRRLFLANAAATVAAGVCFGTPRFAFASSHRRAFDARTLQEALSTGGMPDAAPSTGLRIDAADTVENAAAFPLQVTSTVPDTQAIAIVIDRNPFPFIARISFSPPAAPYIALRVRIAESSQLRVLVSTPAGRYVAIRSISSAVGGCAGGDVQAPRYPDPPAAMKMRASLQGKGAELRLLLAHPMENGLRTDASGKAIPERFIHTVSVRLNDRLVVSADLGRSVAADPLITLRLTEAKAGDLLTVNWQDTHGASRTDQTTLGA